MDDNSTRWVTLDELSAARHISRASAKTLSRRRKWARRIGNGGLAHIAVPVDALAAADDGTAIFNPEQPDLGRIAGSFEAAIGALSEQLIRAQAEVERARQAAQETHERERRALLDLALLREHAKAVEDRAAEAERRLAELQAEALRRATTLLAAAKFRT